MNDDWFCTIVYGVRVKKRSPQENLTQWTCQVKVRSIIASNSASVVDAQ